MPTAAPDAPAPSRELALVQRVESSVVVAELEARAPAFRQLLGTDEAVARFNRGVVLAITKNPDLMLCTPQSVLTACFEAAAQGLEPTGAAGGAHLVPYKNGNEKIAQLIPDYRGVIRLIMRDGVVTSVEANVVKEGDEFAYQLGSDPWVQHTPSLEAGRSAKATTHAYAVMRLRGSATPIVTVEDRAGLERVMNRGGRKSDKSPWSTDFDEMAKKTMVKRGAKLCPVDPAIRAILVREDEMSGAHDIDPTVVDGTARPTATRVSRLAARLGAGDAAAATEEAGDDVDEGAWTDDGAAVVDEAPALSELTLKAFQALREEHGVSPVVVAKTARDLFPDASGIADLSDGDRAALWLEIEKRQAA
jgi:recombination protein RecT